MDSPNYYAIIPADVRYDNDLRANEKLLYGEISALADRDGFCWAQNEYFAKLYNVNKKTVSVWINNLKAKGYIATEIVEDDKGQITQRKIYVGIIPLSTKKWRGSPQKNGEGIHKKMDYNNININISSTLEATSNMENKKKWSKPVFDHESKQYKAAVYLSKMICGHIEYAKPHDEKTLQSWAYEFDLMFRIDGYNEDAVKRVLMFSQEDPFWQKNILSAKKFREKFLQLSAKMEGSY